ERPARQSTFESKGRARRMVTSSSARVAITDVHVEATGASSLRARRDDEDGRNLALGSDSGEGGSCRGARRNALRRHHAANEAAAGAQLCLWTADKAEAVFVGAAGAVARSEEMQFIDHVVMTTYERPINPGPLQDC